ncbi:hypothetical protein [Urbifossiella limnaea]|uniref:YfhO family protein n=1 Tax=Urbifossiella limnaea TaxID=2528023 RepID=A0A517XW18_9BACT|nr:hypothetical protein [Urbifossiella limnaea]QDU21664.1 hypothetical protein ETAA1_36350 [Urbifossiella limnaea]
MGESTPADPPAPAERIPLPSRRVRVGWYVLAAVASTVLIAAGYRVDRLNLREPLDYDLDVLLILPMVKATVENGHHWEISRMGFPGRYELYDFPVVDHLHFAVVWLIGRFTSDAVLVFNLYHLLTWPLTAVTAMWAFRRLGLTHPFACAGGILYAFQPYHYLRGEFHYFLAAYWVIPLTWLPALALCKGELPFFTRRPDGSYALALKTRATGWQVLLAAATASAGAYYAFFACALYCAAGCYGWIVHRTWRTAASAALLTGLVVVFGVLNHAPAIAHVLRHDRTAVTERFPQDSELYGMKIAHLILPIDAHHVFAFRRAKAAYTGTFELNNENACASLGAVASVGFLGLLGVLVVPNRLGWPYRPLAVLTLFMLLYATIGGFSAVFNLLVFDQIRCPNRFSIYMAFLCLLAPLWWLDGRLLDRPGARRYRVAAAVGLVALGVADQTPAPWFSQYVVEQVEKQAGRFRNDREFFARVEEAAPGARVFCLPYMPFPEVPRLHELRAYEHARFYVHTATLVSSYGAIKFRETDEWLRSVAADDPQRRVVRVVAGGFDGLFVDGRGYGSQAEANGVVQEVRKAVPQGVQLPQIVHKDGRQVFLDLRPFRDWLRAKDPAYLDREAERERDYVALCFIRGFPSSLPWGQENLHRQGYRSAAFQIVNPSDRTRTFELTATFSSIHPGPFRVTLAGAPALTWQNRPDGPGPLDDVFTFHGEQKDRPSEQLRRTFRLEIPPGRHTVRVRSEGPPDLITGTTQPIHYDLTDVTFTEVPGR